MRGGGVKRRGAGARETRVGKAGDSDAPAPPPSSQTESRCYYMGNLFSADIVSILLVCFSKNEEIVYGGPYRKHEIERKENSSRCCMWSRKTYSTSSCIKSAIQKYFEKRLDVSSAAGWEIELSTVIYLVQHSTGMSESQWVCLMSWDANIHSKMGRACAP